MTEINDQEKARFEKLEKLAELGVETYPYNFDRSHSIDSFLASFKEFEVSEQEVSLAGRLMNKRVMGKASFAHLMDQDSKIQLYLQRDAIESEGYKIFKLADLGDWVGVKGRAFVTKTGEPSLQVSSFSHLCKSLRPLPNFKEAEGVRFSAFKDVETRYRQRFLDLIVNPENREVFKKRSLLIKSIRNFLDAREFLEVETPSLQPLYGGAHARPFTTHHHTLDCDLYLRISNELYLKRLVVGGFERVYEIGHNFRNEGIDRNHNPEFTAMEFYIAFLDYLQGMDLVEDFFRFIIKETNGSLQVQWHDQTIDFEKPFVRVSMSQLLEDHAQIDLASISEEELKDQCRRHNIDFAPKDHWGRLVDHLFSHVVEPTLMQPTFVTDYPKAISPLAKSCRQDGESLVERFEFFVLGMEFGNAFSELNDPHEQRKRFEQQAKLKAAGDDEAQVVDENFLTALEYGMPPTFGFGMGIDRLTMLLTGQDNIKDVILFPTLRPEE